MTAKGSYVPNSNIEEAAYPDQNAVYEDIKLHIDQELVVIYPIIDKYTLENEIDGHKADFSWVEAVQGILWITGKLEEIKSD